MVQVFYGTAAPERCPVRANMFRDRKRVFIDLLRWDLPVTDGAYEIDAFDTPSAVYLIEADADGGHLGSFRLLPTTQPHLLGSIFPHLSDGPVPTGPDIWEVTRGCLSPRLRAAERLRVRNRLVTAAVTFALANGITRYTCVADSGWLLQIPKYGWRTSPLGPPQRLAERLTGALEISIDARTPERFRETGTYAPSDLEGVASTPSLAA